MQLRPGTLELIERLNRSAGVVDRLFGRNEERLSAIEALGATDDVGAIPHLIPNLLAASDKEATAAAVAIDVLLSHATDEQLILLDYEMRSGRDTWYFTSWNTLEARDLSPRGTLQEQVRVKIASFHPNGFVREAAVTQLARATDGTELPFLLLRLNDWVPQVRVRARSAIDSRLTPSYTARFLSHFRLVTRLSSAKRASHDEILVALSRLLNSTPSVLSTLRQMLSDATFRERRALFNLALLSADASETDIVVLALRSRDAILRCNAVRRLPKVLPRGDLVAALEQCAHDHSSMVRREAILLLSTRFLEESLTALSEAVIDPSASVRDLARFYLSKAGPNDFAAVYRGELGSRTAPSRLVAALGGLSEVGARQDAAVAASWMNDPSARVRRAAIRAVSRLDAESHLPDLLRALDDPARSVSAAARSALRPHASEVGLTTLWQCFESSKFPHVRRNTVELFAALPKWESVCALLRVLAGQRGPFTELANDHLIRWNVRYNQPALMPTREQLQAASAALEAAAAANRIHPLLASQIRFAFASVANAVR